MASADFYQPIVPPFSDSSTWQTGRPPRVGRATFIPYTRRIYFYTFRVIIGLWILWPPRPDVAASYAVAVRRAGTLLTASFGFHLAVDTLAVRLTVPITRVRRGLSPPGHQPDTTPAKSRQSRRSAPCLAHHPDERGGSRRPLFFWRWQLGSPGMARRPAGGGASGVGRACHDKLTAMIRTGLAHQATIRRDWRKKLARPIGRGIGS